MLNLITTAKFRKDLNLATKRGLPINLLDEVLEMLIEEKTLDSRYYDHALTGNFKGFRECHILPNWLLFIQ